MMSLEEINSIIESYQDKLARTFSFERRLEVLRDLEHFGAMKTGLLLINRLEQKRVFKEKHRENVERMSVEKVPATRSKTQPVNNYLRTWRDTETTATLS